MEVLSVGDVLERRHADAAIGIEDALAGVAQFEVAADHALDGVGDLVLAEAWSHDLTNARVLRTRAAELELVELHALLVDAQNPDVSGMVMAAGIDAAGNLDLEFADMMLAVEIGETLGEFLCDRDRAGIREIAIIV